MQPSDYEITNGYVGSLGVSYKAATDATLAAAIAAAAEFNNTTTGDIESRLEDGLPVRWRKSPNYTYDHSHGLIRRRKTARPTPQTLCDCGHYSAHPMSASQGTACPDCYDAMSG